MFARDTLFRGIPLAIVPMVLALSAGPASPVSAQSQATVISRYEVRVDGLACPFCAFGLEKKFKKLSGVAEIDIDLDAGLATFDVAEGVLLLPDPVLKAVRDAGFTSREIEVTASGTVNGSGGALHLVVGEGAKLQLVGGKAHDRLVALVEGGRRSLTVSGIITVGKGTYELAVNSVQERSLP